jgi:hypothetical protein
MASSTPIPDGTYVFMFAGTPPQGSAANQPSVTLDGTFTLKSGAVQSGEFDENGNNVSPTLQQAVSGGTLTYYADGLGQLVLNVPGGTITFSLAVPASALTAGSDSDIRMIEYDDTTGAGTRGSGVLKLASQAFAPTSGLTGQHALLVSGASLAGGQEALAASMTLDGKGNITGGAADSNQTGTHISFNPPSGTYAVDATGRGLLTLTLQVGTNSPSSFHYSFFQASPSEWLLMSIDQATANAPVVIGPAYSQTGTPFSAAPIAAGNYVLEMHGLVAPSGATPAAPDVIAGIGPGDGSSKLTFTYDEYNGTLVTAQTAMFTYAVDATTPNTGHIATTNGAVEGPVLYLIDANTALVLGRGASAPSGLMETQTSGSFTNTSFSGNYLGGSLPLVAPPVLNEAGLVQADGQGNIIITTNRSNPSGLSLYQYITGTYATDSTGRVVVTTPDGITRIFYVVSPTKAAYLTNDSGGYLGSFEQ